MKKRSKRTHPAPDRWGKAALKGCDWFCNSQVIQRPPNWDANHGRFLYNVHVPSRTTTLGIGWTQARGVMCLLAAYERTGDDGYLEAAERALGYAKTLQNMDRRFPLTYGAFHEETPQSTFSYPRDAIELADAFMQWYIVTGDEDALYRAELFFSWFKKNALAEYPGFGPWVKGKVSFDGGKEEARFTRPVSCEMGCISILARAHRLTGKAWYRRTALALADSLLANYVPPGGGALREPPSRGMSHHTGEDGVIYNDDGGGVSLLNAYLLSGREKYLEAAVSAADYFASPGLEIPLYSGIGSAANFLLEVHRVQDGEAYREAALRLARKLLALQVKKGPKLVRGAFRGEDEGGHGYVKGSRAEDFVTTRVTCYAVLALFKCEGVVWPRGYAAVE